MAFDLAEGSFDAILFDCDGTLVDTAPVHLQGLQDALATRGLSMAAEWYYPRVGLTPDKLFDAYESQIATLPMTRAELVAAYTKSFQGNLGRVREIAIVADVARAWHGKVPMCVCSNGEKPNVEATLGSAGLISLFDFILTAGEVGAGKPEPDLFLAAARRMQVQPERCIVFEDSDEGLEAARHAGMRGVDIRKSYRPAWMNASSTSNPPDMAE
ncbi:MAG: HAD family phosphatase [Acidobacteria bacterium]|nr:HAD family phosphatase [Acidobacteriota bacterium]